MTSRSLVVDRSDLADTAQPDQLAELLIAQLTPQLPELLVFFDLVDRPFTAPPSVPVTLS